MAFAMYPNVVTVARRIFLLWAFSNSSKSKQILIHSFGETSSAPLSAILPTSSIQFSWTFSFLFFKIGVKRGSSSFIGGFILDIPTSITMLFKAPKILPNTSGYYSLKHPSKFKPKPPSLVSYPQIFMLWAILETKSAACWRTLMILFPNLQLMVPTICMRKGLACSPSALTMAPNPLRMMTSSVVWFWKAVRAQLVRESLKSSVA